MKQVNSNRELKKINADFKELETAVNQIRYRIKLGRNNRWRQLWKSNKQSTPQLTNQRKSTQC